MKKLIALTIALVMVLALVPSLASAATTITTSAALLTALETGGDIVLGGDIEVPSTGTASVKPGDRVTIPAGVTVNLDLAGYKLSLGPTEYPTGNGYFIAVNGKLTVSDSSAAGTGSIENMNTTRTVAAIKVAAVDAQPEFVLASGTIKGVMSAIGILGDGVAAHAPKVTINGGSVVADMAGAIQGNGSAGRGFSIIEINDGEIYTVRKNVEDCGIYHPQYGTLKVNGGNINAGTGITMMAGVLEITGGTITGAGSDAPVYETSNGSKGSGAAVCLIQNSSYGKNVAGVDQEDNLKIAVTGGTLESEAGYAVDGYTKTGETVDTIGEVAITAGTLIAPAKEGAAGTSSAVNFTEIDAAVLPAEKVTIAPAVEVQQTIKSIEPSTGSTDVEMRSEVRFVIVIPAKVDFGTMAKTDPVKIMSFDVKLSTGYLLEKGSSITVVPDDNRLMKLNGNDDSVTVPFTLYDRIEDATGFTCTFEPADDGNDEMTDMNSISCNPDLMQYAGAYSGTMIFTITYVPPTQP